MHKTDFNILTNSLKRFPNIDSVYFEERTTDDNMLLINCNVIVSNNNIVKNIDNLTNLMRQIIANLETFKLLLNNQKIRFNYSIISYKDYVTIMEDKESEEYQELAKSNKIYKRTIKK